MKLLGWNSIPDGYGVVVRLDDSPNWLRFWFHTPYIDRFAYPVMVRRGFARLVPQPGTPGEDLARLHRAGWQVDPRGEAPRSLLQAREEEDGRDL